MSALLLREKLLCDVAPAARLARAPAWECHGLRRRARAPAIRVAGAATRSAPLCRRSIAPLSLKATRTVLGSGVAPPGSSGDRDHAYAQSSARTASRPPRACASAPPPATFLPTAAPRRPGFYVVEDEPAEVLETAEDGVTPLVVAPRIELTLEWLIESPPPEHTWEEPPIFYDGAPPPRRTASRPLPPLASFAERPAPPAAAPFVSPDVHVFAPCAPSSHRRGVSGPHGSYTRAVAQGWWVVVQKGGESVLAPTTRTGAEPGDAGGL
jgi:hypothetical protein